MRDPRDKAALGPLFDPPFVRGSATSEAAAHAVKGITGQQRARIYRFAHERAGQGTTCDEVEVMLGLKHQTASARIRELVQSGHLRDSGRTRPTRSGCKAVVYVVVQR